MKAKTFNGLPCIHGHGTLRYANKKRRCVECVRLESKRYRPEPKPKVERRRPGEVIKDSSVILMAKYAAMPIVR